LELQKTYELGNLLSKKWLTPQQLSRLKQTHGIFYKTGKFSAEEDRLLRIAIQTYQTVRRFYRTGCPNLSLVAMHHPAK
jgi:hypothetical protein